MANSTQPLDLPGDLPAATPSNPLGKVTREPAPLPWAQGIMYFILVLGVVVAIVPFLWMISASLMTAGETALRQLVPDVPQWDNYAEAWSEAKFSRYFVNSVVLTAVTLAGQLITSVLAAYAFARIRFFGRDFIFSVLLSTIMVPAVVVMIPNFQMIQGRILPLPGGSWMNTLQGITVPFMANVFFIFLLRQFFAQIPNELWDAARIDGAGHLLFLLRIVLPISRAALFTVLLLGFIDAWNDFLWPLLVTTTETWRPLMVGLWSLQNEFGPQTQLIMAASMITILPVLVLYFIAQKQFTEGIATSGLKG